MTRALPLLLVVMMIAAGAFYVRENARCVAKGGVYLAREAVCVDRRAVMP